MPDLALADAPVSNVFGLLRQVRFVLLDMAGGQLAERFAGFAPALDIACASAMDTAARPEWQGVEAVLLRPDGHIGGSGRTTRRSPPQACYGRLPGGSTRCRLHGSGPAQTVRVAAYPR